MKVSYEDDNKKVLENVSLDIKENACNLFIGLRAPTRGYFNKEKY